MWVENGCLIILHVWSKIVKPSRSPVELLIKKKNRFEFVLSFFSLFDSKSVIFPPQSLATQHGALRLLKPIRYFSYLHFLAMTPFFQSACPKLIMLFFFMDSHLTMSLVTHSIAFINLKHPQEQRCFVGEVYKCKYFSLLYVRKR